MIGYYQGNRESMLAGARRYRDRNRSSINERSRERNWALRVEAIQRYGGVCSCCGEEEMKFLTLDHPNGDGATHRRQLKVKAGVQFYKALRREDYATPMQVLCFNCHMAKDKWGTCPHQKDCHI
jgi:predicted HNH restriction endonuclease